MNTGEHDCEMVWVNGEISSASEATISVSAPGLTLGLGCFETLCVELGRFFRFSKHYERLLRAGLKLGLTPPLVGDLSQAILGLVEINGYQSSRCRVRVSCYLEGGSTTTVVTTSKMPLREPTSSTILSQYRVNEYSAIAGIKCSSYAMNLIALREAQQAGADEALMLNTAGELCEAATSNLFLVNSGKVFTPHLASGCLPGIAREAVIELCQELNIPCLECALNLADLAACDQAFLTSSLRRIQPITTLDGKPVGMDGTVLKLQSAYQAKVHGS